tara:strand:- start:1648 stop:1764 length:117 start_codon:yes stop_codon:yes gene_type:complete
MIRVMFIIAVFVFVVALLWGTTIDNYQAIRDEINAATN